MVRRMAHNVVAAQAACDRNRAVLAAVVDDQDLDPIHAGNLARDGRDGDRQRLFFVVAGYLSDQFHNRTLRRTHMPSLLALYSVRRAGSSVPGGDPGIHDYGRREDAQGAKSTINI